MAELNESQRIWIKKHCGWILNIDTEWRFNWWVNTALGARAENKDIYVSPEVEDMRDLNHIRAYLKRHDDKLAEHDGLLTGMFRQFTVSFGGLLHMDKKIKEKAGKK
jgi:hypothetical protein